jgi:hypothetical protein
MALLVICGGRYSVASPLYILNSILEKNWSK